jgi:hypothetical protein
MDKPTIQSILHEHYPAFDRAHPLQKHVRDAVHAMSCCRTAALGGHKQVCPDGHHTRIWYNSCKHRACPQCASLQSARWLEKQKARLLDSDHYHAIFTIPHDFNDLWQLNFKAMANLLFRSVKEELMAMLADPHHLGALPGLIIALHTWGQTLSLHPHLHCLITGGGLQDGEWKAIDNGFLLPVKLLMRRFRARFLKGLRRLVSKGELVLPEGQSPATLEKRFAKLEAIKWNVRIQERYSHGQGVAHYLARYLRGGPIGNSRLLPAPTGKVRFTYYNNHDKDESGRGKPDTMTLSSDEFLRRLFLHIPPARMITIRSYGLYAPTKGDTLNQCRQHFGQAPVQKPETLRWQEFSAKSGGDQHPECCPVCGKKLVAGGVIAPLRGRIVFLTHHRSRAPPNTHRLPKAT